MRNMQKFYFTKAFNETFECNSHKYQPILSVGLQNSIFWKFLKELR